MTAANIGHPFHICRHPWGYIARFISRKISGMGGWIEGVSVGESVRHPWGKMRFLKF